MQKPFLQFGNILNDQCDIGNYVETIPVVRKQTYDQYDIAHYVGTIPVVREQTYDQCDIAHYVGTIPVVRKQTYDQYDIAHYVGTIPVVRNRLMINMIQHIMQEPFLQFGNILNDRCDIVHYVGTIPVVHVVNSTIINVHILSYYKLVLYFYMYLSEMTFLTNSSPIILIIKILSYLMFCNGNVCYQQCMFHEYKLPYVYNFSL